MNKIKQIEKILGTPVDGVWGDDDKAALNKLVNPKKSAPAPPQGAAPDVKEMPMNQEMMQPTTYR